MPIDPANYPADWPQIRQTILERDGHRCKQCGVANHVQGWRDKRGEFHELTMDSDTWTAPARDIRIVLTVAHLDHDTTNSDPDNLAALCQRCHLQHDQLQHIRNAARTRRQKRLAAGQIELF